MFWSFSNPLKLYATPQTERPSEVLIKNKEKTDAVGAFLADNDKNDFSRMQLVELLKMDGIGKNFFKSSEYNQENNTIETVSFF